MKYLITGAAGFIGYHLCRKFCENGIEVTGIDNLNSYYDVSLKEARLNQLSEFKNFKFIKTDLTDIDALRKLFDENKIENVINLAAQPGVRYSITNPEESIKNNINAFFNILECCKSNKVKSLIFASSSSVYGNSSAIPFSVKQNVDHPVSLYAATKKSNELMAFTYHHLYKFPVTGLRFFTVYGPWGRPDMAYFSFTKKILNGEKIDIYNFGNMERDFTYIDDVTESIYRLTLKEQSNEYRLFNIGGEHPVKLLYFIETLEKCIGKKAIKNFCEMQPGDVLVTYSDTSELSEYINFRPSVRIEEGIAKFVEWYKSYYRFNQDKL